MFWKELGIIVFNNKGLCTADLEFGWRGKLINCIYSPDIKNVLNNQ